MDEAGSDPSSSTLKSSISSLEKAEIDDDTLLAEMMEDVQENKVFTEGVETEKTETEKYSDAEVPEEDQSPSKAMREFLRKLPKTSESSSSKPTEIGRRWSTGSWQTECKDGYRGPTLGGWGLGVGLSREAS